MKVFKSHLVKYAAPTKWDHAPYCTMWRVEDQSQPMIFIQMSTDGENPIWTPISDIMVKAFERFYNDPTFVDECILLYKAEHDQTKPQCKYIDFVKDQTQSEATT